MKCSHTHTHTNTHTHTHTHTQGMTTFDATDKGTQDLKQAGIDV